jgi:hypothetical protein
MKTEIIMIIADTNAGKSRVKIKTYIKNELNKSCAIQQKLQCIRLFSIIPIIVKQEP